MAIISIKRKFQFIGCACTYKVELDGFYMGKLGARDEVEFNVGAGTHTINLIYGKVRKSVCISVPENLSKMDMEFIVNHSGENLKVINSQYINNENGETGASVVPNGFSTSSPIIQDLSTASNKKPIGCTQGCLTVIAVVVIFGILVNLVSFIVNNSNDTSKTIQTVTENSETSNEEKAQELKNEAAEEFADGEYLKGIELCNAIRTEYSGTETAETIGVFFNEQISQYTHISARELTKAYNDNEVKADNDYKDQVLVINGIVSSIGKTNGDSNLCVVLQNAESGYFPTNSIQLNFDTDQAEAVGNLSEGKSVTVVGRCDGHSGTVLYVIEGTNVMIKDCYVLY